MEPAYKGLQFQSSQFVGVIEKKLEQYHQGEIWCLDCIKQSDGEFIVSAGADMLIKFWNIQNNFQLTREIETGHIQTIFCMLVIDDETILTGSGDATVKITKKKGFFKKEFKNIASIKHPGTVNNLIKLGVENGIFATGCRDNHIRIFNINKIKAAQAVLKITDPQCSLSGRNRLDSLYNGQVIVAGGQGSIEIFSYKFGKKFFDIKSEKDTITCIYCAQEGFIITGHNSGDMKVWWVQFSNLNTDDSRVKLIQTIQHAHADKHPVLQIIRLGERSILTYSENKKGCRLWRFNPDDGQIFVQKKISEEAKHESNAIMRLDDKRFVSADFSEKRLYIFK